MTMCVGFMCRDGVVLGSDRQMTIPGSHTFSECKLHSMAWVKGRAIWGYSGSPDTAKRLYKELESSLSTFCGVARSELREHLESALKTTLGKKEEFYSLFGARAEGDWKPLLLMSDGVKAVEVEKCEIIGHGDSSVTRYLRGKFLRFPSFPTVGQAIAHAIYFVAQAKKYQGQFVGGGTDVYLIDADRRTKVMDVPSTDAWEKELDLIEFRTDALFRLLSDNEITEERISAELEAFNGFSKDFCTKVRAMG